MMITTRTCISVFCLGFSLVSVAWAGPPKVTQFSAELEMTDFHDSTAFSGTIEPGQPVVLTFKNNTVVKVLPVSIEEKNIRLKTQILANSGGTLYNATFVTHYNTEAELSEKNEKGTLLYRLKLNPHAEFPK